MAIIAWLTIGCSDRERLNPIDPLNPKTGGIPVGLSVISLRDTVKLSWQALELRSLSGYRIYRRTNNNASFSVIDSVAGNMQSFSEVGLALGVHYVYRITAYSGATESNPSDTVGITPGPAFTWIADAASQSIFKLTHDGLHQIFRAGSFQRPSRLQANPKTGQLWVLDGVTQELRRVEANGAVSAIRIVLSRPIDLAVDSVENSVWVVDRGVGVFKYDGNGVQLAQVSLPEVIAIDFHYPAGELWALDGKQKKLWRINRSGAGAIASNVRLLSPQSISISRGSGAAWIADSARVLLVQTDGRVDTTSGYAFAYARTVAVNQNNGEGWAIDWSPSFARSKVVKFSNNGSKLFAIEDFSAPSALAVNVFDGSCFITEPQLSRITHVSATGRIINQSRNFSGPTDVDVENRPLN